jgi:hypothetical protein
MSRLRPPRKKGGTQSKCRTTASSCLKTRYAVSPAFSCGAGEASTSRIANRICLESGKRNNIEAGSRVFFFFFSPGARKEKKINM